MKKLPDLLTGTDPHPHLEQHGSFENVRLGRVAARHDPRTLKLAKYLDDAVVLPEIPESEDFTLAVPEWPMYGNNSLGDCTIAAAAHMAQSWGAAVGRPLTPDEAAVVAAYWATGDGSGTDDTGRFEVDVLNYWRQTGIAGDRIEAYAYVDAKNLDHVRAAIYLFGGVYTGLALPVTAQTQQAWDVVGDGQTGDSQPGSWGGHAVPYLAYAKGQGFKNVTWGGVVGLTEAFHLAYCDELYAPISRDFLNDKGLTPAGFDLAALQADLAELTRPQGVIPIGDFVEHGAYVDAEGVTRAGTPPWAATGEQETPEPVAPVPVPPEADDGYYWNG